MAELGVSAELCGRLTGAGLEQAEVVAVVRLALAEDLAGGGDVTTAATIGRGKHGTGLVVAREVGVVAGLSVAEVVFELVGAGDGAAERVQRPAAAVARPGPQGSVVRVEQLVGDGDRVGAGQVLMTVEGALGGILTAERTALNLLCHLSGVATLTRRWVDAVAGTGARIGIPGRPCPGCGRCRNMRCGAVAGSITGCRCPMRR